MIINISPYAADNPKKLPIFTYTVNGHTYSFADQNDYYQDCDGALSISPRNEGNFEIKFFKSGILKFVKLNSAKSSDICCVGGGGAGGPSQERRAGPPGDGGGGGAGGEVSNNYDIPLSRNKNYSVTIGSGGTYNNYSGGSYNAGSPSTVKLSQEIIAEGSGGTGGSLRDGGWGWGNYEYGKGGYGSRGDPGAGDYSKPKPPRSGRAAFDGTGNIYGTGGQGGYCSGKANSQPAGEAHTGNGGGGGNYGWESGNAKGTNGGSGIIILRNHQKTEPNPGGGYVPGPGGGGYYPYPGGRPYPGGGGSYPEITWPMVRPK